MTRQVWNPWQDMRRFQEEVNRLFERPGADYDFPPLNVTREAEHFVVETPIPGVNRDSLEVTATGNTVTIKGERKAEPDVPANSWHRRERVSGRFVRSVKLDTRLATDQTKATYRDGILRIEVPIAPEAKPHRIQIAG